MAKNHKHIRITVYPGAGEESVEQKDENAFEVYTRAPASGGQANTKVCEIIARFLQIPRGRVRIVKGHRSQKKILEVDTSQEGVDNE